MPAHVSGRVDAPARSPIQLILPVTDRLARAHDMDRPIDAVHDRDAVSQSARVLDLDSEVEQAVPIPTAR